MLDCFVLACPPPSAWCMLHGCVPSTTDCCYVGGHTRCDVNANVTSANGIHETRKVCAPFQPQLAVSKMPTDGDTRRISYTCNCLH